MRKFLYGTALTAIVLSSTAVLAENGFPPQPEKCPGVASIIAGGVSRNVIQIDDRWFTGRRNMNYDTTVGWSFIIGSIDVETSSQAYNAAVTALPTLVFRMGPFQGPIGKWVCLYNTDQNYPAVAVYTPIAVTDALAFFNKL